MINKKILLATLIMSMFLITLVNAAVYQNPGFVPKPIINDQVENNNQVENISSSENISVYNTNSTLGNNKNLCENFFCFIVPVAIIIIILLFIINKRRKKGGKKEIIDYEKVGEEIERLKEVPKLEAEESKNVEVDGGVEEPQKKINEFKEDNSLEEEK